MKIWSVDFVVPDDRLHAATKALLANFSLKPLSPCPDATTCPISSPARYTPPPSAHLHIEDESDFNVGLYPQSDTLWFLPPLDEGSLVSTVNARDVVDAVACPKIPPYFCRASDNTILPLWRPGRGDGVFETGYHAVLVPRAHVLLEAFLRLYARDVGKRIGSFAMSMITYMEEYVDDDGLLDSELLSEPLRGLYKELRAGKTTVRQWTRDLQEALGISVLEGRI